MSFATIDPKFMILNIYF